MLQKINLLLIVGYLHAVVGDIREPTCYSRFDYDEKMLLKLLKIEDKTQKFQGSIDEIKDNYEQEKAERRKVFDSEMDSLRLQNVEEVEKQKNLTAEIQEAVTSAMTQLEALLQKAQEAQKDDVVAFTVTNPSTGPTSGSITFSNVVTNKGDDFDTTTGKFTCTVSGLYYFSVHLTKKRSGSVDAAGCYLKMNEQSSVRAFIDPQDGGSGADAGSYDDVVAFTVTSPSNGPVSNSITFSKVVTNRGDGFDTTTGKFTCTVSGLYYFSVHLTKKRSSGVDTAGCYLKKNGQSSVRAFIDPQDGATGADNGSYGMSTSVFLELEAGDVISLEECSSGASEDVESWSTMSGFLAKPKV